MLELNGTIIAVILNFLILLWILARFFYKPLEEIIESRKKLVYDNIDQSEKKLADAEALKNQYELKLRELESKSAQIIEETNISAKKMQEEIIENAKNESANIIASAKKDALIAQREIYLSVKNEIASLIYDATKKILARNVDANANSDIVNEAIQELEKIGMN